MKKIKAFLNKYHVLFFIAVAMNLYFIVVEIVNFIDNASAISLFTIFLYSTTLIYMCLMEYFEWKHKDPKWSYIFTLWFLIFNAVLLPATIISANVFDTLSPFYIVSYYFGGTVSLIIMLIIYFAYLLYKFIKAIVKSIKAKKQKDDYARCGYFGDIISGLLTLISSFAGVVAMILSMYLEMMLLSINSIPFLLSSLAIFVLTIVFIVKCARGIHRIKKEQVAPQEETNN